MGKSLKFAKGDKIMYIKKVTGYIVPHLAKGLLDTFSPITTRSQNWKRWVTNIGPRTCLYCFRQNGIIYPIDYDIRIPVHENCHCEMITKKRNYRILPVVYGMKRISTTTKADEISIEFIFLTTV